MTGSWGRGRLAERLARLPDVGAYVAWGEGGGEGFGPGVDVEGLGGVGDVGDDQDFFAVGGAEGYVGEGVEVVGVDADGVGRDEFGDLRHGVKSDVAADVV